MSSVFCRGDRPTKSCARLAPGFLLLELLGALALLALTGLTTVNAALRLRRSALPSIAAAAFVDALDEARLHAYRSGETASVTATAGSHRLRLSLGRTESVRSLVPGIVVREATRGGRSRFYPSGLADNASWRLTAVDAPASEGVSVIVNQRGTIHTR